MNFEEALRDELSSITSLSNKVFPLNAPEGTKAPYVIYVSNDGVLDKSFEGYLKTRVVDCEINILHKSYGGLKSLAKDVLDKVKSFQSRNIGGILTKDGPFIQNITYSKPVEIYESEVKLYRSVIDIKVKF